MKITKNQFIKKQRELMKSFEQADNIIKHEVENMIYDRVIKQYPRTNQKEIYRILDLILKN